MAAKKSLPKKSSGKKSEIEKPDIKKIIAQFEVCNEKFFLNVEEIKEDLCNIGLGNSEIFKFLSMMAKSLLTCTYDEYRDYLDRSTDESDKYMQEEIDEEYRAFRLYRAVNNPFDEEYEDGDPTELGSSQESSPS